MKEIGKKLCERSKGNNIKIAHEKREVYMVLYEKKGKNILFMFVRKSK